MKIRNSFWMGLAALLACLFVYLFEPAFLQGISRQTFDSLLRITASPPESPVVVLVDIDEASLKKYGQWPWPRFILGALTEKLWADGAKVVAFDMAFAEDDRLSPVQVQTLWREIFGQDVSIKGIPEARWDFDSEFAHCLEGGNVVLGCFADWMKPGDQCSQRGIKDVYRGHYYERGWQRSYLPQAASIVSPVFSLAEAASGLAFVNTTPDNDNIVRRTPLVCSYGSERIYPSLALEAVRLYLESETFGIVYDASGTNGVRYIQIEDKIIPTDAHGRLVLNYRTEPFPVVPAHRVLEEHAGRVSFSNTIALVGTSAAGLRDVRATPLYPEMPGFEIQATAIENILSGAILNDPSWMIYANMLAMVLLGLLLITMICRSGAVISLGITLLSMGGVVVLSYWCLKEWQLVVLPMELILCQMAIYVTVTIVEYSMEERDRKKIRMMFSTMVSAPVLQYLEEHPESFALTGVKRQASVFFSDIAGFTSISEKLDPEQVSKFMNRYLTPATEAIMQQGGYVDKFYGDAMIAVWGVPYPVDDHAERACIAAIEQQRVIADLRTSMRSEFGHDLRVRMGINTGEVTAGNMGTDARFEYTVLGDTVNLAARFEPANKVYGTWSLIGENTYQQAKDAIEVRLLDRLVVMGESVPVCVYELLGRKGEISAEKRKVSDLYEEALRFHWERKWDQAEGALEKALHRDQTDAPCVMLRHRIDFYRVTPPELDWGGEYVRTSK